MCWRRRPSGLRRLTVDFSVALQYKSTNQPFEGQLKLSEVRVLRRLNHSSLSFANNCCDLVCSRDLRRHQGGRPKLD